MSNTQIDVQNGKTAAPREVNPWRSFRDELENLFEQFSQPLAWPGFGSALAPAKLKLPTVDIAEDEKAFTITAELPGLAAGDVDVSLNERTLVIKGEKRQESKTDDKNYHLTERSYGAFERSFYLPDGVDANAIKAAVDKGVLTVTLPKLAKPAATAAKKIEVKAA